MMEAISKLTKKETPLVSYAKVDKFTKTTSKAFDYKFDGTSKFFPWEKPDIPETFKIGVIVGSSGSGKSTLLKEFGEIKTPKWDSNKAIVSHFDNPDIAINKLTAVGLNTIPSWNRPYHVLSTGEKFRADLARIIESNVVIDEFTSVVDRNVAKAASVAISRYVNKNGIENVVIATCHKDIIDWLEPDWVINTDKGEMYDGNFTNALKSMSKYTVQNVISGPCLKTITI